MQETKYKYEVLVGEDKSTDNSREILKKYEAAHPGKIKVLYREKNLYNERIDNNIDLFMRGKGKYLAFLEGDDFWTDKRKIEKQITFLEKHPEYVAVAHNCVIVDRNSRPTGELYPECKDREYTFGHYAADLFPGQTATIMFRNLYRNHNYDWELIKLKISPGDRRIAFALLCNGKVRCVQRVMSAYRYIIDGESAYSSYNTDDDMTTIKLCTALLKYAYKIKNDKAVKAAEIKYFRALRIVFMKRIISFGQFMKCTKLIRNRKKLILFMARRDFNRFVLKKEVSLKI